MYKKEEPIGVYTDLPFDTFSALFRLKAPVDHKRNNKRGWCKFQRASSGRGTTAYNSEKIAPFSFLRTVGNSVGKTDTSKSGRITIIQRLERGEKTSISSEDRQSVLASEEASKKELELRKTVDAKMATRHFLQTVIFFEVMKLKMLNRYSSSMFKWSRRLLPRLWSRTDVSV